MGEALIDHMGEIFTGAALFVTAVASLLNIWFTHRNRRAIRDTKAAIVTLDKKVDDGAKEVQRMLGDITKTAVTAATTRAVRATDVKAPEGGSK